MKPENILLSTSDINVDPIVKVADFGLAKAVDSYTMLRVGHVCFIRYLIVDIHRFRRQCAEHLPTSLPKSYARKRVKAIKVS